MQWRRSTKLGSARVSFVGAGVFAIADFLRMPRPSKDRFGETPKPARETRALPDPISHEQLCSAALFS